MDAWTIWILLAVVLTVGEIFSLSLFLAPFAAGALLGAVVELAGAGSAVALIVFVSSSLLLLGFVRPIARRHMRTPAQLRTGTAALVGRTALVMETVNADGGAVKLEGEVWTARPYVPDEVIQSGCRVHVVEIQGATALVSEA